MADENTAHELDANKRSDSEGEGEGMAPNNDAEETEESIPEITEADVRVRNNSAQAHIIARQKRTIEKLKSQSDDGDYSRDDGEDEPVTHADLKPIIDAVVGNADEVELNNYLKEEPAAKKYEKAIKVYMNHPAYSQIPVQLIYHHLAFSDATKSGAKKKMVADIEAGQMKSGGTSRRPTDTRNGNLPTADEINNMSAAEFESLTSKARTGAYQS